MRQIEEIKDSGVQENDKRKLHTYGQKISTYFKIKNRSLS